MLAEPARNERGQLTAEVSNAVVAIHKRAYGKGPVRTRVHLSRDLLAVVLEGGFTRAEQTLYMRGHSDRVIHSRRIVAEAIEQELRAAVERILDRAVRSFMSAPDPTHEMQVEVFVLRPQRPEGSEEPSWADGLDASPAGS